MPKILSFIQNCTFCWNSILWLRCSWQSIQILCSCLQSLKPVFNDIFFLARLVFSCGGIDVVAVHQSLLLIVGCCCCCFDGIGVGNVVWVVGVGAEVSWWWRECWANSVGFSNCAADSVVHGCWMIVPWRLHSSLLSEFFYPDLVGFRNVTLVIFLISRV